MSTVLFLPPVLFAARIAYCEWILTKIYIATTAPDNTFGAFLDPQSVKLDEYLHKAIHKCEEVSQIDSRCGTVRILGASLTLWNWLVNYRSEQGIFFQQPYSSDILQIPDLDTPLAVDPNVVDFTGNFFGPLDPVLEQWLAAPQPNLGSSFADD